MDRAVSLKGTESICANSRQHLRCLVYLIICHLWPKTANSNDCRTLDADRCSFKRAGITSERPCGDWLQYGSPKKRQEKTCTVWCEHREMDLILCHCSLTNWGGMIGYSSFPLILCLLYYRANIDKENIFQIKRAFFSNRQHTSGWQPAWLNEAKKARTTRKLLIFNNIIHTNMGIHKY